MDNQPPANHFIGKTLQRLRKQQQLNQDYLAHLSGLTREYIGMLERNIHNPTLWTIQRLAKSFGMEPQSSKKDSQNKD